MILLSLMNSYSKAIAPFSLTIGRSRAILQPHTDRLSVFFQKPWRA